MSCQGSLTQAAHMNTDTVSHARYQGGDGIDNNANNYGSVCMRKKTLEVTTCRIVVQFWKLSNYYKYKL